MSIVDSFLVSRLIELVKGHRCVYDPRHPQHTNRAVVNSAWRIVAAEMNFPETICREKWANLRSNYARELRKARRKLTEEGPTGKPESQWLFYEAMSFLAPFVKSRLSTLTSEETQSGEEVKPDPSWYLEEGGEPMCELSSKRLRPEEDLEEVDVYLPGPSPGEADDDRLFLLSLVPSLRRLPPEENLSFRVAVQTMLAERLALHLTADRQTQTQPLDLDPTPKSNGPSLST